PRAASHDRSAREGERPRAAPFRSPRPRIRPDASGGRRGADRLLALDRPGGQARGRKHADQRRLPAGGAALNVRLPALLLLMLAHGLVDTFASLIQPLWPDLRQTLTLEEGMDQWAYVTW